MPSLSESSELRELLASVYTPEGVETWLQHAEKHGWTLDKALALARALIDGTFV